MVTVVNTSNAPYNGTLVQRVTAFPSQKVVTSFTTVIRMPPEQSEQYGFSTSALEAGQYVAESYIQVFDPLEIFPNGTSLSTSAQSNIDRTTFQVFSEQDLNNRIIAYGTIAGSIGTASAIGIQILTSRKRLKHETNLRWKELYGSHSKLLAEDIANNWQRGSGIFATHKTENDKFIGPDPKEPGSQYTANVKVHLSIGYPGIWNRYLQGRQQSVLMRDKMVKIADDLRRKITARVGAEHPRLAKGKVWDRTLRRMYDPENMATALLNEIRWQRHGQQEIVRCSFGQYNPGNNEILTTLFLRGVQLALGEKEEMAALKNTVDQMLGDSEIDKLANEYFEEEKKLADNENILEYQKGIEKDCE